MDKPDLIIFKFNKLYEILKETEEYINFRVIEAPSEKILNEKILNLKNFLVISQKTIKNLDFQLVVEQLPINLFKLLEKINIKLIKSQYNLKSKLFIGKYTLDLNSRELAEKNIKLKLTEKEIDIIIFLNNSKTAISVDKLQSEVWGYNLELDTHTVETHIYRLRKKLLATYNDDNFIKSKKNGYQIK